MSWDGPREYDFDDFPTHKDSNIFNLKNSEVSSMTLVMLHDFLRFAISVVSSWILPQPSKENEQMIERALASVGIKDHLRVPVWCHPTNLQK